MNVCLVWPRSTFLIDPKVMPPLGLFYLMAALWDHEVAYVDTNNGDPIPQGHDIYMVSGTSPQAGHMRMLAKQIREQNPKAVTMIGGPHATLCPQDCQAMGYDVVVRGEGERIVPALVTALELGATTRSQVTGKHFGPVKRMPYLDGLWPSRKHAGLYSYEIEGRKATTMMTSRGCPYKCAFCSHAVWGQKVTWRSAADVVAELHYLKDQGYGAVMFYDDTFTLDRRRLGSILRSMIGNDLDMLWRCFIRSDHVAAGTLGAMHEAGCVEVLCGVESGSQTILDNINKQTTVEQNTLARQWCREAGVKFKALMILGLPGETEETMEETKRWVLENEPDRLDLVTYMPFPQTPITNEPWNYDLSWDETPPEEWWYKGPRDTNKCLVSTNALSAERIAEKRLEILEAAGIPY